MLQDRDLFLFLGERLFLIGRSALEDLGCPFLELAVPAAQRGRCDLMDLG